MNSLPAPSPGSSPRFLHPLVRHLLGSGWLLLPLFAGAAPLTALLNVKEASLGGVMTPSKAGSPYYLTVQGGTPPYTVTAPGEVVRVAPRRGTSNSFDLTPLKAGTADLLVKDAAGASAREQFRVNADAQAGFKASASAKQIELGQRVTVTLTGGTPPYSYKPIEPVRLKVDRLSETSYQLTSIIAGAGAVEFRDAQQRTVNVGLAAPPLAAQVGKTELRLGEATELVITGGTAPYQVSANASLSLQKLAEQKFRVTAAAPGRGEILLSDSQGGRKTIAVAAYQPMSLQVRKLPGKTVTVSADPRENADNFLRPGEEAEVQVTGGLVPLVATAAPAGLVEVSDRGSGKYLVRWKAGGTATITFKDALGKQCPAPFTLKPEETFRAEVNPDRLNSSGSAPTTATLKILGGRPPYTVELRTHRLRSDKRSETEFLLKTFGRSGNDAVTVRDAAGKTTKPVVVLIQSTLALEGPAKSIPLNSNTELTIYDCTPPLRVEIVEGAALLKLVGVERPQQASPLQIPPMEIHTFKGVGKGSARLRVSDARATPREFVIEVK